VIVTSTQSGSESFASQAARRNNGPPNPERSRSPRPYTTKAEKRHSEKLGSGRLRTLKIWGFWLLSQSCTSQVMQTRPSGITTKRAVRLDDDIAESDAAPPMELLLNLMRSH
jgi:hypothetical protein